MKKALIIIGAVFAGLALLAIVGSMLPSDEPQKVVIVTETQTPTAEPAISEPDPVVVLNDQEQRVYSFVERTYPKLDTLYGRTLKAIDRNSVTGLVACCEQFIAYGKGWKRLDWANGEVTDLETAFGEYMEANRRYYKNWLNGTVGGGNLTQCATNAIKAEESMTKWAPRVEEELAAVESLTSY